MQNKALAELKEKEWALECAARIFKKKHEVSSKHLRKLVTSEKLIANLQKKLQEKDNGLQKLLSLACKITPLNIKTKPPTISSKISVIIPVRNAGEQLRSLLEMIRAQKKVQEVEIIILDSQSTDNSVGISKEFGAKIIGISQKEFNHGRTRNLGARKANGDYLVFTVQDAIPINRYWLYNMICPFIQYPELAALTSKQFVKPQADLFSLWMDDRLTQLLGFKNDCIYSLSDNFNDIDWTLFNGTTKRRLTFFDNVCSCIRRSEFEKVQFSPLINAEDMEFGVKLLKRRKPMAYLTSTGVYHWHNRGADYVFKRHYMGTKANVHILKNNLPFFFDTNNINWERLAINIIGTYNLVNVSIPHVSSINYEPMLAIGTFVNAFKNNISSWIEKRDKTLEKRDLHRNDNLDSLLGELIDNSGFRKEQLYNFKKNFLIQDFMNNFGEFAKYIYSKHHTLKGRELDFVECIYKIFSITAGEAVGAYYLEEESLNRLCPRLEKMDKLLGKGVCYF